MTILIIARHGNTFESGEPPRRVGSRTDLPLTSIGLEHGRNLGAYLRKINLLPEIIYTSHLRRTIQTAQAVIDTAGLNIRPEPMKIFNEIDYGPDENKTEDEVIARIGENALIKWEEQGIMPPGWSPDSQTISKRWDDFSQVLLRKRPGKVAMVVTSNGIARFALGLTGDFETTRRAYGLKLATGAFGVLEHDGKTWTVQNWNVRP